MFKQFKRCFLFCGYHFAPLYPSQNGTVYFQIELFNKLLGLFLRELVSLFLLFKLLCIHTIYFIISCIYYKINSVKCMPIGQTHLFGFKYKQPVVGYSRAVLAGLDMRIFLQ